MDFFKGRGVLFFNSWRCFEEPKQACLRRSVRNRGRSRLAGDAFVACEEGCRIVCVCSVSGLLFVLDDL